MTTTRIKKVVRDFSEITASLEMPLLRIFVLWHLFKSLFYH
jgi:hypothetical protein